ncbi:MAG: class I SAM-dependent methyltransferase [Myxococcales bacterium]|nr:class I SAM-dependent methyltransferase [Myxococcales bacterium]
MFQNRLTKNLKRRLPWALRHGIEAFRLYDRDVPEFPLIVDMYGRALAVHIVDREYAGANCPEMQPEQVIAACAEATKCHPEDIYLRRRRRQRGNSQYDRNDASGQELLIRENGLSFLVNLTDYLDTGIFLDHRNTRTFVRTWAHKKRFLNLFSYTGTFSVYAAAGGAIETTSVDLSKNYLLWASRNFRINGMVPTNHHLIQADAVTYLIEAKGKSRKFDMIVIDPPTFSNSKRTDTIFDVRRDHPELISRAVDLLNPGGFVVFSTNARKFRLRIEELGDISTRDITDKTIPDDFRQKPSHRCWLVTASRDADKIVRL